MLHKIEKTGNGLYDISGSDKKDKIVNPDKDIYEMSEKEFLLQCGYKDHHIMEFPDGSVMLNADSLKQDWQRNLFKRFYLSDN